MSRSRLFYRHGGILGEITLHIKFLIIFFIGFLFGVCFVSVLQGRSSIHKRRNNKTVTSFHSTVIDTMNDLPWVSTAHIGVQKKQLLENPTLLHPDLTGISLAILNPGQIVDFHSHVDMHEFFYVTKGTMIVQAKKILNNNKDDPLIIDSVCSEGCLFHTVPGEAHSMKVSKDAKKPAEMLYFQLVVNQ